MTLICERCKREIYRNEACTYCGKKICNDCEKSSQRIQKTLRLMICKDCWSNIKKRTAFKNGRAELKSIEAHE
jgi:hypothetical protein